MKDSIGIAKVIRERTRGSGQLGHQSKILEQVVRADKEVIHHAMGCSCCGREFGL